MPPVLPYRMVAAWVALEDIDPDAGPLQYYPGSNNIPPYLFSHGKLNWVPEEMDGFTEYMDRKVAELGLSPKTYCPKKGDVLIWHPLLLHGGGKIKNPLLTRRSIVSHYFAAADYPGGCTTGSKDIITYHTGRYYENRPAMPVVAQPAQLSWAA